ncbi:HNH endonuclease [Staphylococcus aureus]|uniref:HNH endonuclease n=1 Tax=Staphylococcus aureus TaxID=1280 RepID=UPI00215BF36F|nr:HNH endonuclease [Staphylococcus aureus]UVJ31099.1 HNH endonuclease [Staphylococcus aureus]
MEYKTKRAKKDQKYENYWKLTVETTDIHGAQFNDTLRIIIDFIDENIKELRKNNRNAKLNKQLQLKVNSIFNKKDLGSVRKSINQFIKLGFVKPFYSSYHKEAKKFLNAKNNEQREILFSKIFYTNASFNSSYNEDNTGQNQIKFLVKTLQYHPHKQLDENELKALMLAYNISSYTKGYLTKKEIDQKKNFANHIKFEDRKYNQIAYLFNFLKYVDGIEIIGKKGERLIKYHEINDEKVVSTTFDTTRDQYRWRLTCKELYAESERIYGKKLCYFTKKSLQGLTASHIWRFSDAMNEGNDEAAYDYKNTILLEKNTDQYFDTYKMTFDNQGNPIYSEEVSFDYIDMFGNNKIDDIIFDEKRLEYLKKHNEKFQKKRLK